MASDNNNWMAYIFGTASFLQAVVVVGCPLEVAIEKGLVRVHAVHGGFDSCVL